MPRALVIDDSVDQVQLLQRFLNPDGYDLIVDHILESAAANHERDMW